MKLIAVGFSPAQTSAVLKSHKDKHTYPGLFIGASAEAIRDFGVLTRSTKFGIAADGTIAWRAGYGAQSNAEWTALLDKLTSD